MPGKKSKSPVSASQNRLMQAAAHDPAVAAATGVKKAVAEEFTRGAHGKDLGKLPEKVKGKGKKG